MATKEIVTFVDDITGVESDDITTVQFGLDGVSYEIDLNADHAEQLREALAKYIPHARRVGGRLRRGATPTTEAVDARKIREWALENGYELAARGRVPNHVVTAYHEAQAAATAAPTGSTGKEQNSARGRKTRPTPPAFTSNDKIFHTNTRNSRTTATKRTKS